jgi:hypothetical protein
MGRSGSQPTLHAVLQFPPAEVLGWLSEVWPSQQGPHWAFNWLALAEVAADLASTGCGNSEGEWHEWALVAVAVYERLAAEAVPGQRDSPECSSMMLRAHLITLVGSKPGDRVLDRDAIVQCFVNRLPLSTEEARLRSENWTTLPVDQILELRRIKNRLNVIRVLVETSRFQPDDVLRPWLQLHPRFPQPVPM